MNMVMAAAMVMAGPGSMRARGGAVKWREAYLAKKLSRQKNGRWRYFLALSLPPAKRSPREHGERPATDRRGDGRYSSLE